MCVSFLADIFSAKSIRFARHIKYVNWVRSGVRLGLAKGSQKWCARKVSILSLIKKLCSIYFIKSLEVLHE